jgi:hypothetical protein
MFDLLVSDCSDFRSGDSTLRIHYEPADRSFTFEHSTFSDHNDAKTCSEREALNMLSLFLKMKYGVLLKSA